MRLTLKNKEWACQLTTPMYDKLHDLEDIEEELGIDLITLFKALKNGIYGTMYGMPKGQDKVIFIEPRNFKLCIHIDKPCLYYVWGYPGPDGNHYYFKEYGKTWSIMKEDLE